MTDDRIEAGVKKAAGRVEDAWGGLTGDARTQARGKADQASGAVQDAVGQARERAQDLYAEVEGYAKEQPAVALGLALGLGVVLGLLIRGSGRD